MDKLTKDGRKIELAGQTLLDLLDFISKKYYDQPALRFVGQAGITYKELNDAAKRLASYLQDQGIVKGSKVALLSENRPEWGIAYLAVVTLGAVIVPILPDFHKEEIAHILEHSDASVIIASERFIPVLPDNLPKIDIEDVTHISGSGDVEETLIPEDLAAIIYTSGTTGQSKGVMLSHRNIVSNAVASTVIPNLSKGDSLLSVLPLSHTYECTIGFLVPMLLGCNVNYLTKAPSATVLMAALKEVRPHAMLTVPLFIEKIYKAKIDPALNKGAVGFLKYIPGLRALIFRKAGASLMDSFGGRMKFFGVGGAALSPEVERFLRRARFPYAVGYGLTETSPLIAGSDAPVTRYRQIGPVIDGVEVRIEGGENGVGEVVVRGPNVMMGYYRNPEKTAEVLDEDGWFHTGDLGAFDSRGYLGLKGRLKNMILGSSGENIYPESIEAVLNRFRFVADSLVVKQGNGLVARVQLDRDAFLEHLAELRGQTADRITDFREALDHFLENLLKEANLKLNRFSRLARIVEQVEPFKKTPTLKIKRYLYH